jgi:hypothetical protein
MPTRLAPALFVLVVGRTAIAQIPATSDTIVPWTKLTERPRLRSSVQGAGVQFPAMLKDANVAGEVRFRVNVGSDGVPKVDRSDIESSTHEMFTHALQRGIGEWRFTAPMLDGRPVRTTMSAFASFLIPPVRNVPTREINELVIDSTGLHISIGRQAVPPRPGLAEDLADRRAAFVAILSKLVEDPSTARAIATCVGSFDSSQVNVSSDVFRDLRSIHPEVLNADKCPPTYASMRLQVDASGKPIVRPKGELDPAWVSIQQPQIWTTDLYVSRARITQGTRFTMYFCDARRDSGQSAWTTRCEIISRGLY